MNKNKNHNLKDLIEKLVENVVDNVVFEPTFHENLTNTNIRIPHLVKGQLVADIGNGTSTILKPKQSFVVISKKDIGIEDLKQENRLKDHIKNISERMPTGISNHNAENIKNHSLKSILLKYASAASWATPSHEDINYVISKCESYLDKGKKIPGYIILINEKIPGWLSEPDYQIFVHHEEELMKKLLHDKKLHSK